MNLTYLLSTSASSISPQVGKTSHSLSPWHGPSTNSPREVTSPEPTATVANLLLTPPSTGSTISVSPPPPVVQKHSVSVECGGSGRNGELGTSPVTLFPPPASPDVPPLLPAFEAESPSGTDKQIPIATLDGDQQSFLSTKQLLPPIGKQKAVLKGATAHVRAAWFIFMQKNFLGSSLPPVSSSAPTSGSRADGGRRSPDRQASESSGADAGLEDPGFGYGGGVSAGGANRVECIKNAAGDCLCHLVRLAASGTEYLNVNLARVLAENNDALKHALYQLYVALASAARVPPAVPQWGSLAANHVAGVGPQQQQQQALQPNAGGGGWQPPNPYGLHAFGPAAVAAAAAGLPGVGVPFGNPLNGGLQASGAGGPAALPVNPFLQASLPLLLQRQLANLKAAAVAAPFLQRAPPAAPLQWALEQQQRDSLWSSLAALQAAKRNPNADNSSQCREAATGLPLGSKQQEEEMLTAARNLQQAAGMRAGGSAGGGLLSLFQRAHSQTAPGGAAPGLGFPFSSMASVFSPGPAQGPRRDAPPPTFETAMQQRRQLQEALSTNRADERPAREERSGCDGADDNVFTGPGVGSNPEPDQQSSALRRSMDACGRTGERDLSNGVRPGLLGSVRAEQSPLVPRLPLPRPRPVHPTAGRTGHKPLSMNGAEVVMDGAGEGEGEGAHEKPVRSRPYPWSRSRSRSPLPHSSSYSRD